VKLLIGLLALLGVLGMGFAGVCALLGKPWEIDGGFLAVGALLLLAAVLIWVFNARMEGEQKFEFPGGAKITMNLGKLKDTVQKGEVEIRLKNITMLTGETKEPK
jgi:membrane protein implicated in regulation of membrane protease activity